MTTTRTPTEMREWRKKNPDRVREYTKRYQPRVQAWKDANRDRVRELEREGYYRHRDRRLEMGRLYDQSEQGRTGHAERERRRRERRKTTIIGGIEVSEYERILREDPCSYCDNPMEAIDHIKPLANGGTGTWDNLTAACASCNASKWSHSLLGWLSSR